MAHANWKRGLILVFAPLMLLTLVVACGGGDDDNTGGGDGVVETTEATKDADGTETPSVETTEGVSDDDEALDLGGLDGCSDLVTANEIGDTVGQLVADEQPFDVPNGVGCTFNFESFDYVTIIANKSTANPDQELPTNNPDVVIIEDFHLAYWQPSLNKFQALEADGLGYSVEVAVAEPSNFDRQAAAVRIAEFVRDNLP